MKMLFKYKPRHADLRLDMTPLIDVVLLLIIFFMVTSSFVHVSGIRVQLPKAATAESVRKKMDFVVTVDRRGHFFIEEKMMDFSAVVAAMDGVAAEAAITISSDEEAAFKHVMQLWDVARDRGFKEIIVLTSKEA